VGSIIIEINGVHVEQMKFKEITTFLKNGHAPFRIKFSLPVAVSPTAEEVEFLASDSDSDEPSENLKDKEESVDNKSTYIGVYWQEGNQKWRSERSMNGKKYIAGCFWSEDRAAKASDELVWQHGGNGTLNFPDEAELKKMKHDEEVGVIESNPKNTAQTRGTNESEQMSVDSDSELKRKCPISSPPQCESSPPPQCPSPPPPQCLDQRRQREEKLQQQKMSPRKTERKKTNGTNIESINPLTKGFKLISRDSDKWHTSRKDFNYVHEISSSYSDHTSSFENSSSYFSD